MMESKILFLFPNTANDGVVPLAIAILSAIAKRLNYDVRYFETSFYQKKSAAGEERELSGEFKAVVNRTEIFRLLPHERLQRDFQEVLLVYKPDIIAVSANSLEYELFCELMDGIQFLDTKPFVIVGGVHATVAPDEIIKQSYVDAICLGEGEKAWEEFLLRFKVGQDVTNIQNFWVKNSIGIHKNAIRPLLSEDDLWETSIDYSLFDERHFLYVFDGELYRRGNIELSRGCPYNCSYCVNTAFKEIYKGHGKFMRIRPHSNVQKEIRHLIELGVDLLQFQDESFFSIPYKELEKFCLWYSQEVKLPLMLIARPETITENKVKLVAEMGVPVQVSLGVESGSERILKEICHRKSTIDNIKLAFRLLKQYNLRATAYTMIGFPSETRSEAFETISLIRSLNIDTSIMSIFFPFKGVPLRDYCIECGYISGYEKARSFTDMSILKNQPMSATEIFNIRRSYSLYTRLPEEYLSLVELCERDYERHELVFTELVSILQRCYSKSWRFR